MSIKRHPALQPFSRDHVVGLYHAHQMMWLSEGRARCDALTTIRNYLHAWSSELVTHFDGEEALLAVLPISRAGVDKLLDDHRVLRAIGSELQTVFDEMSAKGAVASAPQDPAMATEVLELCKSVGQKLEQHIRWEEHEFFPSIESELTEQQLSDLLLQTKSFEQDRKRSV